MGTRRTRATGFPRRWVSCIAAVLCVALVVGCGDDGGAESTGGSADEAEGTGGGGTSSTAPDAEVDEPATGGPDSAPRPSEGCGTSEVGAVALEPRVLDVGGTERTYLLTTPPAHDGATPVPLVVDFHGLAEGSQVHATMSQFTPLAQSEGFVAVFPQGLGEPVRWEARSTDAANPDLAYVRDLLDSLEAELCLDTARVYATGLSNGAMMTSLVACTMADRFAAGAPVAGIGLAEPCEPGRPFPMLAFHGTEDPILLFNGGVGDRIDGLLGQEEPTATTAPPPADVDGAGYPESVRAWAALNGCEPDATDTVVTPEVTHRVFDCPQGADVEFYILVGGGHSWPGSEFSQAIASVVGYTTFDIDATALAWEFFQRFALPDD